MFRIIFTQFRLFSDLAISTIFVMDRRTETTDHLTEMGQTGEAITKKKCSFFINFVSKP